MDVIQENIRNLTAFWHTAAAPFDAVEQGPGYGLATIPDTEWPNRAWLEASDPNAPGALLKLLPVINQGKILSVFGDPPIPLSSIVADSGFRLKSILAGMSLDPWDAVYHRPAIGLRRVATFTDIQKWCRTFQAAFGYRIAENVVAGTLNKVTYFLFTWQGEVAGTMALFQTGEVTGVHSVGVIPGARGNGLATHAMHKALECAREYGSSLVALQASEMGRSLYEKMGFQQDYSLYNYQLKHVL